MSYLGRAKSNLKILESLKMLIARVKLILKRHHETHRISKMNATLNLDFKDIVLVAFIGPSISPIY